MNLDNPHFEDEDDILFHRWMDEAEKPDEDGPELQPPMWWVLGFNSYEQAWGM